MQMTVNLTNFFFARNLDLISHVISFLISCIWRLALTTRGDTEANKDNTNTEKAKN